MNDTEVKTKNPNVETSGADSWPSAKQLVGHLQPVDLSLRSFRNLAEIHAIHYALAKTGWNRKRAAKLLSISYRSLLYKIRRHNITPTAEHS